MELHESTILRLIYNEHIENGGLVDSDILRIKFFNSDNRFNEGLFEMGMDRLEQYGYISFTRAHNDYINIEMTFLGMKYMQNQNE